MRPVLVLNMIQHCRQCVHSHGVCSVSDTSYLGIIQKAKGTGPQVPAVRMLLRAQVLPNPVSP